MDAIVELQTEPAVRVNNELCSRYRSTKSECTACMDVCPAEGAVQLADEQGAEITQACIACGACVSACPNGALQPAESDRRLAERIRNRARPSAPFRIACDRATTRADVVLPCLSRLTEAILLEPIRHGAERVELLDPGCSGCQFQKSAPQWERVMEFGRALCESAGLDADRVVRTDAQRRKQDKTRVPLSAPGSRRGMFRAIAAGWQATAAADSTPDAGAEPTTAPAERFRDIVQRHPVNPKRAHLLEVLQALPRGRVVSKNVPAIGTPLARLAISSQCTGCNVCETLCPVGALHHRNETGIYALDFDAALCTGCRVCEAACYHKAVHIGQDVDLSILFERGTITLIRAAQRTCKACRAPILDSASEFCPLCLESERRRQGIARRFLFPGGIT